jgi:hypothetical protein
LHSLSIIVVWLLCILYDYCNVLSLYHCKRWYYEMVF